MMGPARLTPQVKEVVWGGRWLAEALGRQGAADARLGESWEAFSGSVIVEAEFAGRTLGELFEAHRELFGTAARGCPRFPLLVKFIDAQQNLSIQVHPDDGRAMELEGYPYGKTEFWYVLEATDGAEIVYGLAGDARDKSIRAALERGGAGVWRRVPVRAGDVVFIPAGTVHALAEGVVVYELQQDCDITYRLFDWGRTGREIHVEKGLRCIDFGGGEPEVTRAQMQQSAGFSSGELAACDYFRAILYEVEESVTVEARDDSFSLWTCIDGACELESEGRGLAISRGDTVFVPANVPIRIDRVGSAPARLIAGALR
jgi:mannose-6-phosphate isomerase